MSQIEHKYVGTRKSKVLKAHVELVGKILNPKEYVGLYLRHKAGKGYVYSDSHSYLGPGNALPSSGEGIKPYSYADALAYTHDRSYEKYQQETGKKPYFVWHESDQDLIDKTHYEDADELAAKYAFTLKKGIHKLGIIS